MCCTVLLLQETERNQANTQQQMEKMERRGIRICIWFVVLEGVNSLYVHIYVGISAFGGTIQCRLAYHVPSLQHLEILNSTMCESSERNQATAQQQIEKRDRVTESVSGLWYLNESIACMYMCGLVIIFPLL